MDINSVHVFTTLFWIPYISLSVSFPQGVRFEHAKTMQRSLRSIHQLHTHSWQSGHNKRSSAGSEMSTWHRFFCLKEHINKSVIMVIQRVTQLDTIRTFRKGSLKCWMQYILTLRHSRPTSHRVDRRSEGHVTHDVDSCMQCVRFRFPPL